jgi:hypothetical protein
VCVEYGQFNKTTALGRTSGPCVEHVFNNNKNKERKKRHKEIESVERAPSLPPYHSTSTYPR